MKRREQTSKIRTAESPRGGGDFLTAIFVALWVLSVCSSASGASGYGNPSVGSPVPSVTVPLSSYQSGLFSRPNPVDSSGNLVVTGNVGAGKHFRGHIPYRSTTSMQAPLGSTSLDSFMRYTAPSQTPAASAGTYSPFYSSSGTAATLAPGTSSVFRPNTSRVAPSVAPRPVDTTREMLYPNSSFRVLSPADTGTAAGDEGLETAPRLQLWPLSQKPEAVGDSLARRTIPNTFGFEAAKPSQAETLTRDDYRRQMEALQHRLGQVQADVAQLEQGLATRADPPAPPAAAHPNWGSGSENESASGNPQSTIPEGSRREQLLQETARLLASTTGLPAASVRQENATLLDSATKMESEIQTDTQRRLQLYDPSRALTQTDRVKSQPTVETYRSGRVGLAPPVSSGLNASSARIVPETEVVQTSVQRPIRKVDTELAVTSLKEFTRHLQLAERYFQRGAYRHAADAYALATAYRPTDPSAHLGRSHALLATAEYDASAASLAKAMELDPQYVLKKTDLIKIVGGPDAFIARFNELDETVQAGEAPLLQFLLAYIYYQMDRLEEARIAIEAAQRILPSSIPIDLLKAAICQ